MGIFKIPLTSSVMSYTFTIDLDGKTYGLSFHFNSRSRQWYFDMVSSDGVPLIDGAPVFVNQAVLSRFSNPLLPPGDVLFIDTSGANRDPDDTDLGTRVLMMYLDAAEVKARV
jgi:hypothetical protein